MESKTNHVFKRFVSRLKMPNERIKQKHVRPAAEQLWSDSFQMLLPASISEGKHLPRKHCSELCTVNQLAEGTLQFVVTSKGNVFVCRVPCDGGYMAFTKPHVVHDDSYHLH